MRGPYINSYYSFNRFSNMKHLCSLQGVVFERCYTFSDGKIIFVSVRLHCSGFLGYVFSVSIVHPTCNVM